MPDFRATLPFNFVNGTTADANEVNSNLYELRDKHNNSLDGTTGHTHSGAVGDGPKLGASGLDLTANYAWTGQHSWANTTLFSTATANANRFHGSGDGYGGASTVLTISSDALASSNFNYLKCIADYNGTPTTVFTVGAGGTTSILTGSELFLGASSWRESSPNVMTAKTNGVDRFAIETAGVTLGSTVDLKIQPTKKIYLDNGVDTYIDEVSANVMRFVSGNTEFMRSNASGEVLLPDVDPPTANYANRNGIVKAWGYVNVAGPSYNGSYNTSGAPSNGAVGEWTVTLNTDMANTNALSAIAIPVATVEVKAIVRSIGTGAITFKLFNAGGAAVDNDFMFMIIGDQ